MSEIKIGKKSALRNAAKKFERIYKQPISRRISDFLIEEGRRERKQENTKKIAAPNVSQSDLDT